MKGYGLWVMGYGLERDEWLWVIEYGGEEVFV